MNTYQIVTDSACDIKPQMLEQWGVKLIELNFRFDGEDKEYFNSEMDITVFYNKMREGATAKTSAINPEGFMNTFEALLQEGKDVLYIGFSSGLSTTYHSATIAAQELQEKYPQRKVLTVDSLAASAGQGMLVYFAVQKQRAGCTLQEAADFVKEQLPKLCHWFTVDDLVYLKRGGRISPTVAFVGAVLGIKPILHVDDAGKLISVSKVRGRKASLATLAAKYEELAESVGEGTVYISHGDCLSDAQALAQMLQDKHGVSVEIITDVGTVIGAHSGPGTLALFFVGKQR